MSWPLALALFLTIWWTLIFAVLPFGARSQLDAGEVAPGTDPGAPAAPRLWRVVGITTGLSLILWGALVLSILRGWVSLQPIWDRLPL